MERKGDSRFIERSRQGLKGCGSVVEGGGGKESSPNGEESSLSREEIHFFFGCSTLREPGGGRGGEGEGPRGGRVVVEGQEEGEVLI